MGNHCHDCEFCGRDRRVVGGECCPEYVAQEAKQKAEWDAKCKADRDYLSRYGLTPHGYEQLDARDVVAMLKKREGKILKPGRVKKPEPVPDYDW